MQFFFARMSAIVFVYWPAHESRGSLNIALDFFMYGGVFDLRRVQFGKFEYDLQSIFGKFDYDCGPYLKVQTYSYLTHAKISF